MIEANARLFGKLAEAAGDVVTLELRQQKRAVQTDVLEKGWLRGLMIRTSTHLRLGPSSRLALGEYDGAFYLIGIGMEISEPPEELQRVDINAGSFTAIVSELQVPIHRTADLSQRLLEYVFYPAEDGVELLDLEVVTQFFERIDLYRVDASSALVLDKHLGMRAAIAAILGCPRARPLDWPASALDRIQYMIRNPDERAPFHLLFRALTVTKDDAAFLALYRCVEQLFPIPAIAELSTELKLSGPALQVAEVIERHLGWRRREEDAIAHLFGELAPELIDRILPVVGAVALDGGHFRPVAKRVYELRNHCVHYRPIHASDEALSLATWLRLADLMLEVVQDLYRRYATAFDSLDAPAAA